MWHSVIWCVVTKVSEECADFISNEGSETGKVVGCVGKRGMKMHRRGLVWPIRNVNGRKIGGVTVGPEEVNLSEQEEVYQIRV
jgi:hypothetical protein